MTKGDGFWGSVMGWGPIWAALGVIALCLSILVDESCGADVRLQWDTNNPADLYSYHVYLSSDGGATWKWIGSSRSDKFIVPDVAPGDYRFRVTAAKVRNEEETNPTNEVLFTVGPGPVEPTNARTVIQ